MENFKIIEGHKDKFIEEKLLEKDKLRNLYKKNYLNALREIDDKKVVYYGIKYFNSIDLKANMDVKDINSILNDSYIIDSFIRDLSFLDILNMFPIIKDYKGYKYQSKDYWSTKEYLETININEIIGDNIDDFYWNYYNHDIMSFSIKRLLLIDKLRKLTNKESLMSSFLKEFNVEAYSYDKNKNIMIGRTSGKVVKVSKPRKRIPKFLKPIK